MADAPLSVPLSHALGVGTVGQAHSERDNAGTEAGTSDLKTLARHVLSRDTRRDNPGTTCPKPVPAPPAAVGQDQGLATALLSGAERAAIVEHDCKIPRAWAEGFAQLDPAQPPGDMPPHRWQRFVDDVGLFLDSGFAGQAAALGWGPRDLFGCDRDRPFARIDQCGLLWLLNGNRLLALTENTATVEMPTGARQTWRRSATEPGRLLAWELTLSRLRGGNKIDRPN
jgi:hypothetical protein